MLDRPDVMSLRNCVNSVTHAYIALADEIIKNHPAVDYADLYVKAHLLQQSIEDLYRSAGRSAEVRGYLRTFFDDAAFIERYNAYQTFRQEQAKRSRTAPEKDEADVLGFLAFFEGRYKQIMNG